MLQASLAMSFGDDKVGIKFVKKEFVVFALLKL